MNFYVNKYVSFLGLIFAISFLLISPDILFSFFSDSFAISKNIGSLDFIVVVSIVFLINRSKKFAIALLLFFSIIQFAQFCNIKYFGTLISPSSIYLMTKEISDVFEEATYVFWNYIYLLLVIVFPFFCVFKISFSKFAKKYKCKSIYTFSVFLLAVVLPLLYCGDYVPNGIKFSLENSVRTLIGYADIITKNQTFKNYKPYSVEKIKNITESITIVYILGESTNYDHMSLFGYKEDTTPQLKKLAQSPNFYSTKGIAGAVTTIASCKFMLNAIREPDNVKETSVDTTNLFRLAKQNGFKTFYISAQKSDLLASIGGVPYIDVLITREQYPTQFSKKRDSFLFEILKEQNFAEKNFVVIHQRCIHSPYTKTVPKSFIASKKFISDKNKTINEYNAAIFYNDSIISGLFNIFNKREGKYYIFFASDHNELMGKNGLWGHGNLNAEIAQIPVLIQSNDLVFLQRIKTIFAITHYDICIAIANLLGFKIKNPNENNDKEKDIYYINGVDYIGRCGFIKFRKDYKNKKIKYLTD